MTPSSFLTDATSQGERGALSYSLATTITLFWFLTEQAMTTLHLQSPGNETTSRNESDLYSVAVLHSTQSSATRTNNQTRKHASLHGDSEITIDASAGSTQIVPGFTLIPPKSTQLSLSSTQFPLESTQIPLGSIQIPLRSTQILLESTQQSSEFPQPQSTTARYRTTKQAEVTTAIDGKYCFISLYCSKKL